MTNPIAQANATHKILDQIAAERRRQIEVEGFTVEGDDKINCNGELARAAACYADAAVPGRFRISPPSDWPWKINWWKTNGARRNLIKAATLIVAEIERLDRRTK